jgi:hypothetical protein
MSAHLQCLFLMLASLAGAPAAPEPSDVEVAMKTDALINLARYVEWPEEAFLMEKTPFMIGVFGRSKIHNALLTAIDGKLINGRRVMVRRFAWPQVPNSHVLFIAPSERHRLKWVMKKVAYSTTLTVAEFDDFLTYNGILRLSMKDEKVRFHVNRTAAKEVGLRFSSKFLSLADQVVGEP